MHIGVDLDEVLSETVDEALRFHNYILGGQRFKKEELTEYYMWKLPNVNITKEQWKDFFDDFFVSGSATNVKPVEGAKEQLEFLKSKGFEATVVTARWMELEKYTKEWLNEHYKGIFKDVYFAEHYTDNHKEKSEICNDIGALYMIEDNFDYALDTADAGIKTFLIEKPWNKYIEKEHENIIRVKHWREILV